MSDQKNRPSKHNSQAGKFVELARQLGCDESEERFDAALGKVVKHKPPSDDKATKPAAKKPGR